MNEAAQPGPKKGNYITHAWLVILLGLLFGGGLAGVQVALGGKIAENKRNETYSVIPVLVPGADKESTKEIVLTGKTGREVKIYKALTIDGVHQGWVLSAAGQGFADRIEVLIGLNVDLSTITGLYVLSQKETPGLGDYITGEDFLNRYKGKPTDRPLVVIKIDPAADNEIQGLTGATISSESVTDIANKAIENLKEPILGLESLVSSL